MRSASLSACSIFAGEEVEGASRFPSSGSRVGYRGTMAGGEELMVGMADEDEMIVDV